MDVQVSTLFVLEMFSPTLIGNIIGTDLSRRCTLLLVPLSVILREAPNRS